MNNRIDERVTSSLPAGSFAVQSRGRNCPGQNEDRPQTVPDSLGPVPKVSGTSLPPARKGRSAGSILRKQRSRGSFLEDAAGFYGAAKGYFVGEFKIAANRQTAGKAADRNTRRFDEAREIACGGLPFYVGVCRKDDL